MNTREKIVAGSGATAADRNAPDAGANDIDAAAEGLADSISNSMFRPASNGTGSGGGYRFPQWPRRRARFERVKPRDGPRDLVDKDNPPALGKALT